MVYNTLSSVCYLYDKIGVIHNNNLYAVKTTR